MIDRGYLIQPDFEVRSRINFIGGMPDLKQFDKIFISCSGGKDSQAMAFVISELAEKQAYNKENIELVYADTGLEWHDTFDHVKKIGQVCGIKAVMVKPKYKLLDNVRRRWDKFNGRTEQNRTEQNRTEQSPLLTRNGKTEQWQAHSRITSRDSATATTSGHQSSNMSVPISTHNVLPELKNPFPSMKAKYCTGEGKINSIRKFVTDKQEDG